MHAEAVASLAVEPQPKLSGGMYRKVCRKFLCGALAGRGGYLPLPSAHRVFPGPLVNRRRKVRRDASGRRKVVDGGRRRWRWGGVADCGLWTEMKFDKQTNKLLG